MDVRVANVGRADTKGASRVLAGAFLDDPMVCAILRGLGPQGRMERLQVNFELALKAGCPGRLDLCVMEGHDIRSCAVAYLPGAYPPPMAKQVLIMLGSVLRMGTRGLWRYLTWIRCIRRMHPKASHLYLEYLGTDPAHQGKGFGSFLLRHLCCIADQRGVAFYLETANERNLTFYTGFDFREDASQVILGVRTWFLSRPREGGRPL